ncbi:sulfotransferase ssu-1-like [Amblyomma americanum]
MDVRAPRGPIYRVIDGFTFNRHFSVELFRSALQYEQRTGDTFLATFPKSGTVWVQQTSYLILHDGLPPPSVLELHRSQPSLEMFEIEDVEKIVHPGLITTHLIYDLVLKSLNAKYVWVCRNPKDVCVSSFYHTKSLTAYDFTDGKFEDYFEIFLQGANDFGYYFDYMHSWYAHRNDSNVLLLHYEEDKADPRSHVLRLAGFLGEEYHRRLVQEPEILHRVLRCSTIDYMKNTTTGSIDFLRQSTGKQREAQSWD